MTFLARFLFVAFFTVSLISPALAAEFHGYRCTKDCSGHKAGFAWAERKGIEDASNCTGHSQSFREGCLAWVARIQSATTDAEFDKPAPLRQKQALSLERD